MGHPTPARDYFPGMGQAVADRTINRKKENGEIETWADVAARVALGNSLLDPRGEEVQQRERFAMEHHLRQASLLMSGRHLQHGDERQPQQNQELYTNCSTAAMTCILFYLLLNGSGVGRAYDDNLIQVDFNQMPIVVTAIDWSHHDVQAGVITGFPTVREATHLYQHRSIEVFTVPDSREGWAKAFEVIERMAFERRRDDVLVLDFSQVRPKGAPIRGMQNRPASGPGPLMAAIAKIARLRDAGMAPWLAALYADHYVAECVLVGGARRAARMATKHWRDKSILEFIAIKKGGFLWSANNSVTIDADFRTAVKRVHAMIEIHNMRRDVSGEGLNSLLGQLTDLGDITADDAHAYRVLHAIASASYHDGTGEPGIINVDKLATKGDLSVYADGKFANSSRYQVDTETEPLMLALANAVIEAPYPYIVNPCGEIVLMSLGAYCVIGDVAPFFAKDDEDAEQAFRVATRALMRTNLMESLYSREVKRTNRIGVSITGLHEWIYARFGYTWRDLIDEVRSRDMWLTLARFKRAVVDEAEKFAAELGVETPHTNTAIKPAGTTSKLHGLTEGAHLPSMREYLRWVQFRHDDPLIADYKAMGYPVKHLLQYEGTTVVGFPTKPMICELDGGDWVVTAAEATPEEQYAYLRLLEKYWIVGVAEDGFTPLAESGNQVSYTLKYDPAKVSFSDFLDTLIKGQFSVRCCSVMPQVDTTAYEYQPEEPVTKERFEQIAEAINNDSASEDVGLEHVDCSSGACPVDWGNKAA